MECRAVMQFRISRLDPNNKKQHSAVLRLHEACFFGYGGIDLTEGWWWVAMRKNRLAGFCGMIQSWQWCDAGYLCRSGVAVRDRGHGLQKRLIQVRINQARRLGWNWLITDTTSNPASANSLISKGFKLYEPAKPWAFKNSLYWRKRVSD